MAGAMAGAEAGAAITEIDIFFPSILLLVLLEIRVIAMVNLLIRVQETVLQIFVFV
jgi:hypothetical protein